MERNTKNADWRPTGISNNRNMEKDFQMKLKSRSQRWERELFRLSFEPVCLCFSTKTDETLMPPGLWLRRPAQGYNRRVSGGRTVVAAAAAGRAQGLLAAAPTAQPPGSVARQTRSQRRLGLARGVSRSHWWTIQQKRSMCAKEIEKVKYLKRQKT